MTDMSDKAATDINPDEKIQDNDSTKQDDSQVNDGEAAEAVPAAETVSAASPTAKDNDSEEFIVNSVDSPSSNSSDSPIKLEQLDQDDDDENDAPKLPDSDSLNVVPMPENDLIFVSDSGDKTPEKDDTSDNDALHSPISPSELFENLLEGEDQPTPPKSAESPNTEGSPLPLKENRIRNLAFKKKVNDKTIADITAAVGIEVGTSEATSSTNNGGSSSNNAEGNSPADKPEIALTGELLKGDANNPSAFTAIFEKALLSDLANENSMSSDEDGSPQNGKNVAKTNLVLDDEEDDDIEVDEDLLMQLRQQGPTSEELEADKGKASNMRENLGRLAGGLGNMGRGLGNMGRNLMGNLGALSQNGTESGEKTGDNDDMNDDDFEQGNYNDDEEDDEDDENQGHHGIFEGSEHQGLYMVRNMSRKGYIKGGKGGNSGISSAGKSNQITNEDSSPKKEETSPQKEEGDSPEKQEDSPEKDNDDHTTVLRNILRKKKEMLGQKYGGSVLSDNGRKRGTVLDQIIKQQFEHLAQGIGPNKGDDGEEEDEGDSKSPKTADQTSGASGATQSGATFKTFQFEPTNRERKLLLLGDDDEMDDQDDLELDDDDDDDDEADGGMDENATTASDPTSSSSSNVIPTASGRMVTGAMPGLNNSAAGTAGLAPRIRQNIAESLQARGINLVNSGTLSGMGSIGASLGQRQDLGGLTILDQMRKNSQNHKQALDDDDEYDINGRDKFNTEDDDDEDEDDDGLENLNSAAAMKYKQYEKYQREMIEKARRNYLNSQEGSSEDSEDHGLVLGNVGNTNLNHLNANGRPISYRNQNRAKQGEQYNKRYRINVGNPDEDDDEEQDADRQNDDDEENDEDDQEGDSDNLQNVRDKINRNLRLKDSSEFIIGNKYNNARLQGEDEEDGDEEMDLREDSPPKESQGRGGILSFIAGKQNS